MIDTHFYLIGIGNYRLSPQFSVAARSADELDLIACISPQKILDQIEERKYGNYKQNKLLNNNYVPTLHISINSNYSDILLSVHIPHGMNLWISYSYSGS